MLPATATRVETSTAADENERIRRRTEANVACHAAGGPGAIAERVRALDREWDIERTLEANAATLALAGTLLGAFVDRRFLVLPAVVAGFLLQHALQGWCPPVPLFRRLGVRTATEIGHERYALKALRGDFSAIRADGRSEGDARAAVEAARM